MCWYREFANRIEFDFPLGRSTWFRVGGSARFLFRPEGTDQLSAFMARAEEVGIPTKVLGAGANMLVCDDGYDGVVVRLDEEPFRSVQVDGETVKVGGGVDMMPLSRSLSERGFSGLEFIAGIPATVGGAIRMNAGGPSHEMADVVAKVTVMDVSGGVEEWDKKRIGFGYRESRLGDRIVLSAKLQLTRDEPRRVKRAYDEQFELKRRTQPLADRSAGCIFKNPPGASAGALIDRAGLKGRRCGGAHVSDRHANFIVADATASASDVLRLIDVIREQVFRTFSTKLETEIEILEQAGKAVGAR